MNRRRGLALFLDQAYDERPYLLFELAALFTLFAVLLQ